jgi:hypothetical protein
MKTLTTTYSFTASPIGRVQITSYPNITLDQILLITNVTRNSIIYNFADPTRGGYLTGNVLTLSATTTSMLSTDRLQIFVDDLTAPVYARYFDATTYSPVTSISAIPALTGTNAFITIDAQTGGAMALQGDLDKDIDSVTTFDVGYGSVSNFLTGATLGTALTGTGTQVLSANSNRITLFGQNLGTLPLYVKYGLGCNQNSFNFILYPGTAAYDGRGEKFSDDRYKGDVSVNTLSGLSGQCIFWEGV